MEEVVKTLAGVIAGLVSGIFGYLKIESSRKKRNEEIDTRLDENRELKKEVEGLKETVREQGYILEQKSKEIELLFDKYDQTSKELRQLNENFIRFSTNIENMMRFIVPQSVFQPIVPTNPGLAPGLNPTCVTPTQK